MFWDRKNSIEPNTIIRLADSPTPAIANPLTRLPSSAGAYVSLGSKQTPSSEMLAHARSKSIDIDTALLNVKQFLAGQRADALQGNGAKYRPPEIQAQRVPLATEVDGFTYDNEPVVLNRLEALRSHESRRLERGKVAEELYKIASEVKDFSSANAHLYVTCLELADMFDESIKYRLAKQLVNPDWGAARQDDEIRKTVALITSVMDGKTSIHPPPEAQYPSTHHIAGGTVSVAARPADPYAIENSAART